MGNCFSCFKVPPPPNPSTNAPLEKDKEEIMEVRGMLQSSQDLRCSPLTVVESQINGNSKGAGVPSFVVGSDNCGSLHRDKTSRTFYPRIPPLGRASLGGGGESKGKEVSESKLNALFEQYRDSNEDSMLADGIERFCSDLGVSPDEFKVLVFAWQLNAEQMCRFSRSEFMNGCRAMRVDSIRNIQTRLPELVTEVSKDPEMFKDLYRFTFRFGLDAESGQRILPSDMAICLWRLVFTVREPPILPRWLFFLETHPHVRGIPRDTWNMFLNFAEAVGNDLSSYDDTEAWPSLFDDFVEFENDQMNQNISKDKDEIIKQDCE
ncbi:DCN1-like protein 3 [Anabrus simplex]|uniref:DCN1-like protein 3 n=1 Tax=Anabrus simplex TaxID=316456 RepID=UPI0034DD063F